MRIFITIILVDGGEFRMICAFEKIALSGVIYDGLRKLRSRRSCDDMEKQLNASHARKSRVQFSFIERVG